LPVSRRSRYADAVKLEAPDTKGVSRPALGMRLPPRSAGGALAYRHVVTGPETLEEIAWKLYGDSTAWWRLADLNPKVFPLELEPGSALKVADAADVGRIQRTRNF